MGNVSKLKSKLSNLRKLQPKHPLLFAHIADCYLMLGNFRAAKRVLRKGVSKYPDYSPGWIVEGQYFLLHNQPEKARISFKKVTALDPFNSYAHERCSELAADINDQNDYRFHIRAMSKLDPLSDNIQKMRQADDPRQIAINNGIFTLEDAEGQQKDDINIEEVDTDSMMFSESSEELDVEAEITTSVASHSEEDDSKTEEDEKPKTFAEFQALQLAADEAVGKDIPLGDTQAIDSEISEEDDEAQTSDAEADGSQLLFSEESDLAIASISEDVSADDIQDAKDGFDIQSLGITDDIVDDIDDIISDEELTEPASDEPTVIPTEEEIQSVESLIEQSAVEDPNEVLDSVPIPEGGDSSHNSELPVEADEITSDSPPDRVASEEEEALQNEPESIDRQAEIPVIAGLEGVTAVVVEDYSSETSPVEQEKDSLDQRTNEEISSKRKRPEIESVLSQIIGEDDPVEKLVAPDEQPPMTQPEPEPIPIPKPKSPVDKNIKKQLQEIAAEVTGVKPITSEPKVPLAKTTPEPDPQKPRRIATKTLAELYASQGDWHRAISVYEELLGRHPGNDAYKQRINVLRAKLR